MKRFQKATRMIAVTLVLLLILPIGPFAQEPQGKPAFSQAELEQILAPAGQK